MNSRFTEKCFLLLVTTLAIVSCKRDISEAPVYDQNEMMFQAARTELNGVQASPAVRTPIVLPDAFGFGSTMGLYVQTKSNSDAGNTTVEKANSHYVYALPVWKPNTADDRLLYHDTEPVYVFAYHPHSAARNSTVSTTARVEELNFALRKEQSSPESVQMSDLLYVADKGAYNAGYNRQRVPINLQFKHLMCKVSFYVRLIDSKPNAANPTTKGMLKNIMVAGPQIFTKGTFNVFSGALVVDDTKTTEDTVLWNADFDGVELPVGDNTAEAVHITDMLLMPFVAADLVNYFRYDIFYPEHTLRTNFITRIPSYVNGSAGIAGKLRFRPNSHNRITVTLDVSDNYVQVDAKITKWGDEVTSELPAEKD